MFRPNLAAISRDHDMQIAANSPWALVANRFSDLSVNHPEWAFRFENSDPVDPDHELLLELLETAPNEFAAGLVLGLISRHQHEKIRH